MAIKWGAFFTPFGCRSELPTYAFQREPIQVATRPPRWQTGTSTTKRPTRSWDLHYALTVTAPGQHAEIVLGMARPRRGNVR
ncbi:PKS/NRPS-like protein biosynthetic cluster [Penicillium atrosanguineum]|uniref:PKS/NRPS-like protein biosynthetic cluster n=1 Tax=Penicillium atrosanguineum TaxID=1132637 RepID=A0A9W9PVD8_9EURO|nr:uncharacterized protein N7443_005733 [Penicillium atrosanguineum]KAJ5128613.1 PKS/NRPS-like protein biosynthetic cluster [Penicillium atrosanguineum]KAJ5144937.1 PKS/NRPS-like protein biosynthetic cluster [Penicillium atrosanguineum]KAJ5300731.1 hypothetical protein N7443_005733 [Penicillium atrosanguineum]KAJ5311373.1 PKS/NRPS-like protein biosynthetic cluster [Penicillium atrosanguineum]